MVRLASSSLASRPSSDLDTLSGTERDIPDTTVAPASGGAHGIWYRGARPSRSSECPNDRGDSPREHPDLSDEEHPHGLGWCETLRAELHGHLLPAGPRPRVDFDPGLCEIASGVGLVTFRAHPTLSLHAWV